MIECIMSGVQHEHDWCKQAARFKRNMIGVVQAGTVQTAQVCSRELLLPGPRSEEVRGGKIVQECILSATVSRAPFCLHTPKAVTYHEQSQIISNYESYKS